MIHNVLDVHRILETGKQMKGEDSSLNFKYVDSHNCMETTNGQLDVDLGLSCESSMLGMHLSGVIIERGDALGACTEGEDFLGQCAKGRAGDRETSRETEKSREEPEKEEERRVQACLVRLRMRKVRPERQPSNAALLPLLQQTGGAED